MDNTIATFKYIKHKEDIQSAQNIGSSNFQHPSSISTTWILDKLIEVELVQIIDRDDHLKLISDPTCNPYFYINLFFEYFGDNHVSQRQIIIIGDGKEVRLFPAEVVHTIRGLNYKMIGIQVSEKHKEMIKIAIDKYKETL